MKKLILLFLAVVLVAALPQNLDAKKKKKKDSEPEALTGKSEFRGAWIQTAWQDRYQRMSPEQC